MRPQFLWQTILDQTEEHFEVNQRRAEIDIVVKIVANTIIIVKIGSTGASLVSIFLYIFFIKARDQTEEHFEVKQRSSREQEEQTKVSQSTPPLLLPQSEANQMETYEMNRLFSFSHYC